MAMDTTGTYSISLGFVMVMLIACACHYQTKTPAQTQLAQTEQSVAIVNNFASSVARPQQAHIGGQNSVTPLHTTPFVPDEVERLPQYEPPPPLYEEVAEQWPAEMRDLERGEPPWAAMSGHRPPGY